MAEGVTAITWLAVFLGGGVGSVLRFALGQGMRAAEVGGFPWAVLAANVLATALLAWCAVAGAELWGRNSLIWFFMTAGVCGGFSTFSTFAWDTLRLWEDGGWALAATNVAVSVVGCVAVSWWVARRRTLGAQPASKASCQRAAQRHQLSPALRPSKPNSGLGVLRSLPWALENSRNSSVTTAQTACRPKSSGPTLQQPSR